MTTLGPWVFTADLPLAGAVAARAEPVGAVFDDARVNRLVTDLFTQHARSLVRMARIFVDDKNAAEDLVQEAFIRLARSAHRIDDRAKAAPYLRSIVLNLARDHNRRGLVSLRHRPTTVPDLDSAEDELVVREDQREVLDAVRALPLRQRDCVVLRYYLDLGIPEIADTLGISANSVKTHLKRGLAALEKALAPGSGEGAS
jgi:RNA polymerase sigma-70 factor (ECF subfamily)